MKRITVLILVLLLCIPACAGALTAFDTSSSEFQWHFSDMLEQYIDWQVISAEDEYSLLYGETETLPALFLTEDRSNKLYEVAAAEYLPTVYNAQTDAILLNLLETMDTATDTISRLQGNWEVDIKALNQNTLYTILWDARARKSMDFLLEEPISYSQHVADFSYTHELFYDEEENMIYYSLIIHHD